MLIEEIVAGAKRSEFFPTGQTTFVDPDDLIALGNEELKTKLVPGIVKIREDFFLRSSLVPLVVGISRYQIPSRAIGDAFKDIFYVSDTNLAKPIEQLQKSPMSKVQLHDVQSVGQTGSRSSQFYIEGNEIILLGAPTQNQGAILFQYYQRANKLVPTSQVGKITAISSSLGITTITVNTDLTAITTPLVVGALVDVLSGGSPYLLWSQDVAIQTISTTTVTFNTLDIADANGNPRPKLGDYICAAQTANIPIVPEEFHVILSEMIASRCLKALGHAQQYQTCMANVMEMSKDAYALISQRVEQELDIVYERNGILNSIGISSFNWSTRN